MKKFYLLLVLMSLTALVKAQDEALNTEKKQLEGFADVDTRCKYCEPNQNNIDVNGDIKQCIYPLTNVENDCVCKGPLYKNVIGDNGQSTCTLNIPSIN